MAEAKDTPPQSRDIQQEVARGFETVREVPLRYRPFLHQSEDPKLRTERGGMGWGWAAEGEDLAPSVKYYHKDDATIVNMYLPESWGSGLYFVSFNMGDRGNRGIFTIPHLDDMAFIKDKKLIPAFFSSIKEGGLFPYSPEYGPTKDGKPDPEIIAKITKVEIKDPEIFDSAALLKGVEFSDYGAKQDWFNWAYDQVQKGRLSADIYKKIDKMTLPARSGEEDIETSYRGLIR